MHAQTLCHLFVVEAHAKVIEEIKKMLTRVIYIYIEFKSLTHWNARGQCEIFIHMDSYGLFVFSHDVYVRNTPS